MLEIKNTVTEVKTIFDRLLCRLGIAEKRIGELKNTSINNPKTEKQRELRLEETYQNIT
jgi:hypothetical protein